MAARERITLSYATAADRLVVRRRLTPKEKRCLAAALCFLIIAGMYIAAATAGRGGRGFFSPDTLQYRTQSEWLLPLVNNPLYRSSYTYRQDPLVRYLVAEGYWTPRPTSDPKWVVAFQWNNQWHDGQSLMYREIAWRGQYWITWSRSNSDIAAKLWPMVLQAMRGENATARRDAEIVSLMYEARASKDPQAFLARTTH
jgi:hypothetical protein